MFIKDYMGNHYCISIAIKLGVNKQIT